MTQAAPICLVTRPEPEATRFGKLVHEMLGLTIVISPVITIEPCPVSINFDTYAGLILTSAAAARRLRSLGAPRRLLCYAVGQKTAKIAQELGFDCRSADGDAEDLLSLIIAQRPATPLMHLRGEHSRGDIAARLASAGLETHETVVYKQISQGLSREAHEVIAGETALLLPLFSPRSARLVEHELSETASVWPIAMSASVAQDLTRLRSLTRIAAAPTEAAMLEAIRAHPVVRAWVETATMQS